MTGFIRSATSSVMSAVDVPLRPLLAAGQKVWNWIPGPSTVQECLEDSSGLTRDVIKAVGIAGTTFAAGATAAALAVPAIPTCAAAALISAGAMRFNPAKRSSSLRPLFTGLPSNPNGPLLETAKKINDFRKNQSDASIQGWAPPLLPLNLPNAISAIRPIIPLLLPLNPPNDIPAPIQPAPLSPAQLKGATDQRLQTLIRSLSISITLSFIHPYKIDDKLLPDIIKGSTDPGGNLWDTYMKYLGKDLNTSDWMWASIYYFFSYTLGIIPNSIDTLMTNVLQEARAKLNDKDRNFYIQVGIDKIIDKIISFLDQYNAAIRAYAEDKHPTKGSAAGYRREVIEKLGGKSLEDLCQEFSDTIIDEFFPRIPFFETLKQIPVLGYLFVVLDFLIGGLINCIGRKILKYKMPSKVLEHVKKGIIDATSPSNLQFTVPLTKAVTRLLDNLYKANELDLSEPPFKPKELRTVIEKLIRTLELTGSETHLMDSPNKILEKFGELDAQYPVWQKLLPPIFRPEWWDQLKLDKHREAMIDGSNAVISYFYENTEAVFADLLELCNAPFAEGKVYTKKDFATEKQTLEMTAEQTFQKVIQTTLQGLPHARKKEYYDRLFAVQREMTTRLMTELRTQAAHPSNAEPTPDARLQELDRFAEILSHFGDIAQTAKDEFRGEMLEEVKNAFYESFYLLYRECPALADRILALQGNLIEENRHADFARRINQATESLTILERDGSQSRTAIANFRCLVEGIKQNFSSGLRIEGFNDSIQSLEAKCALLQKAEYDLHPLHLFLQEVTPETFAANPKRTLARLRALLSPENKKVLESSLRTLDNTPNAADSQANVLKEVEQLHEQYRQKSKAALNEVRTASTHLRNNIDRIHRAHDRVAAQNRQSATQNTLAIQRDALRLEGIAQSIQPSPVEPALLPESVSKVIAEQTTSLWVMPFFKNVYQFITTKDIYDASTRIIMSSLVEGYRRGQ